MSETPPSSRRFQPVPVEESSKKVRRFAPEPVETMTRSSKKADDVSISARGPSAGNDSVERTDFAGRKRLLPTPVETTFKSSKHSGNTLPTPETTPVSIPASPSPASAEDTPRPRPRPRFAPQLIETSKRSKKAGDSTPATLPTDKVCIGNFVYTAVEGFNRSKRLNDSASDRNGLRHWSNTAHSEVESLKQLERVEDYISSPDPLFPHGYL
jgi:hypothetical protein